MILEGRRSGSSSESLMLDLLLITLENLPHCEFLIQIDKFNPRWETGTKTFKFTTSSVNSLIGGVVTTSAESISMHKVNYRLLGNCSVYKNSQIRRIDHTEQRVQRNRITRQQGPDRLTVNTEVLDRNTQTPCCNRYSTS